MLPFLPTTKEEMLARGWDAPDFIYVCGDAYVDHPSFGHAIISRALERAGYRVCMLPQPNWLNCADFKRFGRPKLGFLVSAGNIDSMVNHYTAAKKPRSEDSYSLGGAAGKRPDRATIVYVNRIREAYNNITIAIGGVEASLRRFAHYDYWDDAVRRSILADSGADLLMYGMGEDVIIEVAARIKRGDIYENPYIRGTCVMIKEPPEGYIIIPDSDAVKDKRMYAETFMRISREQDPIRGVGMAQKHGARYLVAHPPAMPIATRRMDEIYEIKYQRRAHPMYENVPALEEVEFSLTAVRGCFGACSFCALTFHQGRIVSARSHDSLVKEARLLTTLPNFKGFIHDVGGPTANFTHPACDKQLKHGACLNRQCLYPKPCKNLNADHAPLVKLLTDLRALPKIKKVFIRSGLRYDYMLCDSSPAFLRELTEHHVSGQLKVAPEHVSPRVLKMMGKPPVEVFDAFRRKYDAENARLGKKQYLVPYFISSHPGSELKDAVALAEYLRDARVRPEQVQDFYPTPGTLSTAMYYTGLDPRDMKPVHVPRGEEKAMQRALMQYSRPQNRRLVRAALIAAGRQDLIGNAKKCLVPYENGGFRHAATDHKDTKLRPDDKRSSRGKSVRGDSPRGRKH